MTVHRPLSMVETKIRKEKYVNKRIDMAATITNSTINRYYEALVDKYSYMKSDDFGA